MRMSSGLNSLVGVFLNKHTDWKSLKNTLPETNIAPENVWLEYCFPIGFRPIFRGEPLVSGRVMVIQNPNLCSVSFEGGII